MNNEERKALRQSWYDEARKQTNETIPSFLQKLFDYKHDYSVVETIEPGEPVDVIGGRTSRAKEFMPPAFNTICYACSAAAVAAATAINNNHGFPRGAIMWEFITGWFQEEDKPMRLVKFENMLYPQYKSDFDKTISQETADWLISKAKEKLKLYPDKDCTCYQAAHPTVIAHWQSIAKGELPFGYKVVGKESQKENQP